MKKYEDISIYLILLCILAYHKIFHCDSKINLIKYILHYNTTIFESLGFKFYFGSLEGRQMGKYLVKHFILYDRKKTMILAT